MGPSHVTRCHWITNIGRRWWALCVSVAEMFSPQRRRLTSWRYQWLLTSRVPYAVLKWPKHLRREFRSRPIQRVFSTQWQQNLFTASTADVSHWHVNVISAVSSAKKMSKLGIKLLIQTKKCFGATALHYHEFCSGNRDQPSHWGSSLQLIRLLLWGCLLCGTLQRLFVAIPCVAEKRSSPQGRGLGFVAPRGQMMASLALASRKIQSLILA